MRLLIPILLVAISAICPAATLIQVPDAAYVSGTHLVTFNAPDESMLDSISDGILTIAFSTPMRASTVPDNWSSWGSPPKTESSKPRVLWSGLDSDFNPITAVTFTLSAPVSIFGFEAQPDPSEVHTINADFYLGGVLQQTISLSPDGNAGALLFALDAGPGGTFDSVVVSSDVDWAAGQFRYNFTSAAEAPEPGTAVSTALVAMLLCVFTKKRS